MASEPASFEVEHPRQHNNSCYSFTCEATASHLSVALVSAGAVDDIQALQHQHGSKLSICQGFIVMFCTAFGAGIALVGWYPKLAGYYGYAVVLAVIAFSAIVAGVAMFITAQEVHASSFSELCRNLPAWMTRVSEVSTIVWAFILVSLYTQFVYSFMNTQVVPHLFGKPFANFGIEALPPYLAIGLAVFISTCPSSFSGTIAKVMTSINLLCTWAVIIFAIAKGIKTMTNNPIIDGSAYAYTEINYSELMRVSVLLSGSMFQSSCIPQLNYEILEARRGQAAWIIPVGVGVLQGIVFLLVGCVGYFALGNNIKDDGDVFKAYALLRPDWMVFVLQGGCAVLMYLSIPLVALPGKVQLWICLRSVFRSDVAKFEQLPLGAQLLINLAMVTVATAIPLILGPEMFMTCILTVGAGTAATWVNLFLPSCVILFNRVLPARRQGHPWIMHAFAVGWIFLLAMASFFSSVHSLLWS